MTDPDKPARVPHTETPWRIESHRTSPAWGSAQFTYGTNEYGDGPAGVVFSAEFESHSWEQREANAAFIVRACNAHDELVDALHAVQASCVSFGNAEGDRVLAQVGAALAKAGAR